MVRLATINVNPRSLSCLELVMALIKRNCHITYINNRNYFSSAKGTFEFPPVVILDFRYADFAEFMQAWMHSTTI